MMKTDCKSNQREMKSNLQIVAIRMKVELLKVLHKVEDSDMIYLKFERRYRYSIPIGILKKRGITFSANSNECYSNRPLQVNKGSEK